MSRCSFLFVLLLASYGLALPKDGQNLAKTESLGTSWTLYTVGFGSRLQSLVVGPSNTLLASIDYASCENKTVEGCGSFVYSSIVAIDSNNYDMISQINVTDPQQNLLSANQLKFPAGLNDNEEAQFTYLSDALQIAKTVNVALNGTRSLTETSTYGHVGVTLLGGTAPFGNVTYSVGTQTENGTTTTRVFVSDIPNGNFSSSVLPVDSPTFFLVEPTGRHMYVWNVENMYVFYTSDLTSSNITAVTEIPFSLDLPAGASLVSIGANPNDTGMFYFFSSAVNTTNSTHTTYTNYITRILIGYTGNIMNYTAAVPSAGVMTAYVFDGAYIYLATSGNEIIKAHVEYMNVTNGNETATLYLPRWLGTMTLPSIATGAYAGLWSLAVKDTTLYAGSKYDGYLFAANLKMFCDDSDKASCAATTPTHQSINWKVVGPVIVGALIVAVVAAVLLYKRFSKRRHYQTFA